MGHWTCSVVVYGDIWDMTCGVVVCDDIWDTMDKGVVVYYDIWDTMVMWCSGL